MLRPTANVLPTIGLTQHYRDEVGREHLPKLFNFQHADTESPPTKTFMHAEAIVAFALSSTLQIASAILTDDECKQQQQSLKNFKQSMVLPAGKSHLFGTRALLTLPLDSSGLPGAVKNTLPY